MLRLTLIAAAVLAASSACADEKKQEVQKVEIKGAAEAYNPRRDDTASKIIVTSDELKRYGDTSIGDALKRVPGVTVGAGGRDIRMRGLGGGYTQILLNGERAPAGFNLETLSPDSIERIEVIRAASAEFSTQAIAGTINIVLKKAVQTAQRELKAGVGYSRQMVNPNVSAVLSDKDGAFSYAVNMAASRSEFDRTYWTDEQLQAADGAVRMARRMNVHDRGHSRGMELSPRLNWNLPNGDTLTSQSFFNINAFMSTIDRRYVARNDSELPLFDALHIVNQNRNHFGRSDLNWVHKFGEGAKLDAKIGGSYMHARGNWYEADSTRGSHVLQHDVFSGQREQGTTSTGKYSKPIFTNHALAMGWDIGYSDRDDWRDQRDLYRLTGARDDKDEGYQATVRRAAAFAQDEWNLSKDWSVYFGLRWEGVETRSAGAGFDPVRNRSNVWSPLAQTLYKLPNGKDQVRAALTRTYKAPSAGNLSARRFTNSNNSQTEPDWIGNPNLKPELATGIDASYEHYWGEGALLSAAVATRRISNYTRLNVFLEDSGRWVMTMGNNGKASVHSLDLEAKFPLKAVMADAPAVDLRANLSRNWSQVDSVPGPNNRLNQQVPLSANIGVDYKTADGVWSTGGSLNLRAGGLVRLDADRTSYSTMARNLDMYVVWKFEKQSQLRISAWNLLAQDYISQTTYMTGQGSLSTASVSPGMRFVRAQLETRF